MKCNAKHSKVKRILILKKCTRYMIKKYGYEIAFKKSFLKQTNIQL